MYKHPHHLAQRRPELLVKEPRVLLRRQRHQVEALHGRKGHAQVAPDVPRLRVEPQRLWWFVFEVRGC